MLLSNQQWLHPIQQFQNALPNSTFYQELLTHIPTKTIVSKHLLKLYQQQFKRQFTEYQWRFQTDSSIIKPYHAHLIRRTRGAAIVSIYIQFPNNLLSAVTQLQLKQTVDLLKFMSYALPPLIQRYGHFQITQKMISLDKKNKVWINQDFKINKPQFRVKNQEQMIIDLIIMLKNRTEVSPEAAYFFNKLAKLENKMSNIAQFLRQITEIDQMRVSQIAYDNQGENIENISQILSQLGSISENTQNYQSSMFDELPTKSQKFQQQQQQEDTINEGSFSIVVSQKKLNQKSILKDSNKNMNSTRATNSFNQQLSGSLSPKIKLNNYELKYMEIKPCLLKCNNLVKVQNPEHILTYQSIESDEQQLDFPSILESKNWKNNFQYFMNKNDIQGMHASIQIGDQCKKLLNSKQVKQLKLQKYGGVDQIFLSIIQDQTFQA